jgi:hypothetical protein
MKKKEITIENWKIEPMTAEIGGNIECTNTKICLSLEEETIQAQIIFEFKITCDIDNVKIEPYSIETKHSLSQAEISKLIEAKIVQYGK